MIPLVDLKTQYIYHKLEFNEALLKTIDGSHFINGPECKAFEKEFTDYCGSYGYTALCGNGTDALYFAIIGLLGKGDGTKEIITVPNTFIATVEAIINAGYKPVFVDISNDTYLMNTTKIEAAITKNTVGIIPVHLYGQMVPMNKVMEIANFNNLKVIEDAAQAHGATWNTHPPGYYGDAACFSFYPGKNLGCWGDGGAVYTKHEKLAKFIRILSNHGRSEKYTHLITGTNSRLDEIQAAVLRVKLRYLDVWNASRAKNARYYTRAIFEMDKPEDILYPITRAEAGHVYHIFAIEVDNRDKLAEYLKTRGVETGIHYPIPLHKQPALSYLNIPADQFPVTNEVAGKILSLPMYPELMEVQMGYIVGLIKNFVEGK